ncbi:MAG: hypothetical protein A3G35_12670 [candidate division NC10 bacterium RIFCSPLOWO2_12_FULL_66_18]|nr:MAG: hypothetical protein A3H39_04835 [candidate division NC10 bacterium RIFCSPLOWO2_02_FULL_66_22]OGB99533.1 MAG: hypothetical protein A3G35_12670 [candidate division NC10 bacterium RIFCSPLOWO2_12_FULL_66_18]
MRAIEAWKQQARRLKVEVYALYLACKDPRVPWHARLFAACVVGYAFSPIDLIPDPIPILGYLDDLVLIPLGVLLVRRMIPDTVLTECRERAIHLDQKPTNWVAAAVIIAVWILLAATVTYWLIRHFRGSN